MAMYVLKIENVVIEEREKWQKKREKEGTKKNRKGGEGDEGEERRKTGRWSIFVRLRFI